MLNWLKTKLGITALEKQNAIFDDRLNRQSEAIGRRIDELDKLTAINADIGMRGPCTIILSGVYKGRGYVKFYEMGFEEFRDLVERYRWEERNHLIRNVDVPYPMRGAFEAWIE